MQAVKNRFNSTIENITEGWTQLWQKARSAMTRFTPSQKAMQTTMSANPIGSGWGLLAADMQEDSNNLYIRMEVPGLTDKDLSVSIIQDNLVIEGNKEYQYEKQDKEFHFMECAYGHFRRLISLSVSVDESKAQAKCKHGVLQVVLPKVQSSKRKLIKVS